MDDINDFLKNILNNVEHHISTIANIMGILCFFGIEFSKIKSFTISKIRIFRKYVYNVKENIIYRYIKIQIIVFKQCLNIIKIVNQIINHFIKSQFSLASCCLVLIVISIYNPFSYLNRILDIETVVYNEDFNQNIINNDMNCFASSDSANELNSSKSILYFYTQSMYYLDKSLKFDMDDEEKERLIKYISSRYKDIAECSNLNN